ncbi:MAG: argininosuccinate lyase [Acidobacteria bacterium]|jgi:argininosuccinate lyase|nr:argininosuccinate lyase [Acidobacteriota bacterium]
MPFSPDYVRIVLNDNFEDAKTLFLDPLMAIHYAHLVMLHDTGIVSLDDARTIRRALDGIDLAAVRGAVYDGSCEDLFFYLERQVVAACGDAVAGRLHTARSRNDIDMTMYRMRLRECVLGLIAATVQLRQSLVGVADRHRHTVFPAHTHTQPAQPSTVAHYLLGAIEQLERDTARLRAAYVSVNVNPLGACAITGTGFPIDRDRTSALLGFDGTTGNTYGSIATVDYLLEAAGSAAVTLVGVGRLVQDLLLWCTMEVGYLRLTDGFVQVSSIMPQKRNPVALEHARALASKAFAQAGAIPVAVHNTPFGDIVDTEDDLQPLVATMFKDAIRAVSLVAVALEDADFDVEKMRRRAGENWIAVTELADTLARERGLPFKAGHTIAARLVREGHGDSGRSMAQLVAEISKDVTGTAIEYTDAELATLLSPEHFVAVRRTHGGPAPEVTAAAIAVSRGLLVEDLAWIAAAKSRLLNAESALKTAAVAMG